MNRAFIVLTQASNSGGGKVIVQVSHIVAFGHTYGDPNAHTSFIQIAPNGNITRKTFGLEDGCFVVSQSPEEIMALIDKAQALVHIMGQ